jgi:hypothetical protein
MHRELEWPVSKATCLYKKLYMVYSFLYTIIEGTSSTSSTIKSVIIRLGLTGRCYGVNCAVADTSSQRRARCWLPFFRKAGRNASYHK